MLAEKNTINTFQNLLFSKTNALDLFEIYRECRARPIVAWILKIKKFN